MERTLEFANCRHITIKCCGVAKKLRRCAGRGVRVIWDRAVFGNRHFGKDALRLRSLGTKDEEAMAELEKRREKHRKYTRKYYAKKRTEKKAKE